ncbi:MAG: TetR/AcrR family transcriptional regulator [Gemmatimonadetes bacterium]|nr:TetR/AcrR family transcriptional regulator [Gemmatimonadota bacterium]MBP6442715.1 TetR/AcrR family transcriptional regulator [Gemmatimonadales bacterium]MBK7594828.1 TetR/AcrR family transcriptional regulator [Gemmatimonadota bacterium]MBL0178244.1 TetR/AcrR family transcriptional regulator [Gemmatimonadota bacterium]MBP6570126.1 TetR/AcrR family transcriptional regulator [Gemmatimonadales bacterium]
MPPAVLSRDEVVARVMAVVRRQGYDGASLSELSKATGLGKSSLYHYFPDGKDDMVGAVVSHLDASLEAAVFAPLREPGQPAARLRAMNEVLEGFYHGGREACVLAILGVGDASRRFHPQVKKIFRSWIDAIASALRDDGLPRHVAQARAEDAVARIEGALVLARSLDEPAIFGRALQSLPDELLRR